MVLNSLIGTVTKARIIGDILKQDAEAPQAMITQEEKRAKWKPAIPACCVHISCESGSLTRRTLCKGAVGGIGCSEGSS